MLRMKITLALLIFTFVFCTPDNFLAQDSCKSSATENKPIAVSAPQAAYPPQAIAGKAEGDVLVDVQIDATGKVIEATFVAATNYSKSML